MDDLQAIYYRKRIRKLISITQFLKEENEQDLYHNYYNENIERIKKYEKEILSCINELEDFGPQCPNFKSMGRIKNFNDVLDHISKLELTIHSKSSLPKTICCEVYKEGVSIFNQSQLNFDVEIIKKNKKTFLNKLKELNIGEWKNIYVNPNTLDGTSWELKFYFDNSKKVKKYHGINSYPYNFKKILELLEYK